MQDLRLGVTLGVTADFRKNPRDCYILLDACFTRHFSGAIRILVEQPN